MCLACVGKKINRNRPSFLWNRKWELTGDSACSSETRVGNAKEKKRVVDSW